MERFEIHDNQFIKKNVISSLPDLPDLIETLLENWSSNQIGKSGKYEETVDGHSKEPCGIAGHYLCQYYRTEITSSKKQKNTPKKQPPQENNYNYADLIVGFLNVGDVLYALTIADIIVRVARKARKITQSYDDVKSLDEFISSLDDLKYKIEHDNDLNQNVKRDDQLDEKLKNQLNKARKAINKELIYKIDGVTALTREIGTDNFIKYAVDQSYFFAPEVVQKQMEKIVAAFREQDDNKRALPARHSTKKSVTDKGFYQEKQDGFEVDDESTNNDSYKQAVDLVRTAKVAAESAIKISNGKAQDKDNKIKDAFALAKLAILKMKDSSEAIEVVEKEINAKITQLNFDQETVKQWLERKKAKIEERLNDSECCLFTSKEKDMRITDYPIIIDKDGNDFVRKEIKGKTGYTVSEGAESLIQNYRISHIWGRAFDPRYFTNLWNIVLVPAWANDLLDKPTRVAGSLESKLKSTIMRICEVLYFNKIDDEYWNELKMPKPSVVNDGKDVVKPAVEVKGVEPKITINKGNAQDNDVPYIINIIEGKGSKKVGDIVKYAVYI